MKPTTVSVQTVSTVSDTAQVMGIDQAGMGTVLSILSNMYSDGSLAVVREYSSNALDSHREAGNPDPILITSPSYLNPIFTVQDFGTGLSKDEVLNVYAQYGASTKRDSNDQIGAFGIGAKSAFTVGTQFTVTAVKDGFQTIALFALNDNGAPTVNILDHSETLEPNGVRVDVGVRDVTGVNNAIGRMFSTWKSGTVLIDGVEPPSVWSDLHELAEDIHLGWREDRYRTEDAWIVVMGGIPYKLPPAVLRSLDNRSRQIAQSVESSHLKIYLTVPIGDVDITPSREELRVTTKTGTSIGRLVLKFDSLLGAWITTQISDAGSRIEAMVRFRELQGKLGAVGHQILSHVTWRGNPLSGETLDIGNAEYFELRNKRGNYYGEKVATRFKELRINTDSPVEKFLFVTDVPERRVRSVQLAAKAFLMGQNNKDTKFIKVVALTAPTAAYAQDWFSIMDPALTKIDFDSFIKEWKPKPTPQQRGVTSYQVEGEIGNLTAKELKELDEVFYLTDSEAKSVRRVSQFLSNATGDAPIVVLKPTQKAEVLCGRVPGIKSAYLKTQEYARKLLDEIDQEDADIFAASVFLNNVPLTVVRFLEEHRTQITNQSVLKVMAIYRRAHELQSKGSTRVNDIRVAERFTGVSVQSKLGKSVLDPAEYERTITALPLLTVYLETRLHRTSLGDQHVIDYVNSIKIQEGS